MVIALRRLLLAGLLSTGVLSLGAAAQAGAAEVRDLASSPQARSAADWVLITGDARDMPFAIVDKRGARLFVFDRLGRLTGASPALIGAARGDLSAPGVGRRAATFIPSYERTTPAGRFEAEPGHNDKGEAIVWIDYAAAVALHRLRPAPLAQRRPDRLASALADDRRITLGCIVVDPAFYDQVVAPLLGSGSSVVYILPESGDWRGWFADRGDEAR